MRKTMIFGAICCAGIVYAECHQKSSIGIITQDNCSYNIPYMQDSLTCFDQLYSIHESFTEILRSIGESKTYPMIYLVTFQKWNNNYYVSFTQIESHNNITEINKSRKHCKQVGCLLMNNTTFYVYSEDEAIDTLHSFLVKMNNTISISDNLHETADSTYFSYNKQPLYKIENEKLIEITSVR